MGKQLSYQHTVWACYLGYITQAIIVNLAPLLFLTFQNDYNIPLSKITFLVTLNFGVQLLVDLLSAKFVDKIGYRICAITAHGLAVIGLICMGTLPNLLPDPYVGLLISIFLCAIGGGLLEVLISPIVESCPSDRKAAAMSLLHSFYCWGCVFVILLSTLFFVVFSTENWIFLCFFWAILPFGNAFYFAKVPIAPLTENGKSMKISQLFRSKLFWILALLMLCAGSCEQAMSQWSSAFAESGLEVSKTLGDLLGPCCFSILMGIARVFYAKYSEKLDFLKFMTGSGILCICSYLVASLSPIPFVSLIGCSLCGLSVGILWPGTFSLAARSCPTGGTALFALLALAGDLGCSTGPSVVGFVSSFWNNALSIGLLAAIIFPLLLLLGIFLYKKYGKIKK